MNYFLGIFPDEIEKGRMAQILPQYASIFDSQDIPVYYPEAAKYHLTLLYLGERLSPLMRVKVGRALKGFKYKPFNARINSVRLGFSQSRNPGLLHFTVTDENNELRNIVSQLSSIIGTKREKAFIPHITIGRVRNEISAVEYRNLSDAVTALNQSVFAGKEISFTPGAISLVKSTGSQYKILKKYPIN
ncbi:MAG: hypothetical protein QY318_03110 [Candidatus Dojkabacteria bacterium]|nr:MAG: hypothetical protein QY318_03110 [Candidatus Dojkabacteria bacterium]